MCVFKHVGIFAKIEIECHELLKNCIFVYSRVKLSTVFDYYYWNEVGGNDFDRKFF